MPRGTVRLLRHLNAVLARINLRVEQVRPTNWDRTFARWIGDAERLGVDPNDLGDREWGNTDLLSYGLDCYYRPLLGPAKTILELGPGSGRLSRHLIGECRRLILADSSPGVLKWLSRYMSGRADVELQRVDNLKMRDVRDATIDAVLAHGVVEHLDQEELFSFLLECSRIVSPGGHVAFNFDDLSSAEGAEILRSQAQAPRKAGRFRLHHPESIRALAQAAGLDPVSVESAPGRIAFALLVKPGA